MLNIYKYENPSHVKRLFLFLNMAGSYHVCFIYNIMTVQHLKLCSKHCVHSNETLSLRTSLSCSLSLRSMYQPCSDTWSALISSLQTCSILATSLLSSPPLHFSLPLFSRPVLPSLLCSAHTVPLLSPHYIDADDGCCLNFG